MCWSGLLVDSSSLPVYPTSSLRDRVERILVLLNPQRLERCVAGVGVKACLELGE